MVDSQQPVEQQLTSQTPAPKQKKPKTCLRGQSYSQKNKRDSRGTKKAFIEAQSIIANNRAKVDLPPDTPSADPPPDTPSAKNVLTTTQWLSVISIIVSWAGVYYKREEIKSVFTKKNPVEMQRVQSPVLPRAPPPSPVDAKRRVGIMKMD